MDELLQRLQDGVVTLVDVRPPDEFAQGHLPGAVNTPWTNWKRACRNCRSAGR